ncbi:hypothetical protein ACN47E_006986 [Coniothyrium glycines]
MNNTTELPVRLAYIRTVHNPEDDRETVNHILQAFVKQDIADAPGCRDGSTSHMHHRFMFGASTISDAHILEILISTFNTPVDRRYYGFRSLHALDLELHMSIPHAATSTGRTLLRRCEAVGFVAVVDGADDGECDEVMLGSCDYILDPWTTANPRTYFWSTLRRGIPENHLFNNPKYHRSQHDASQWRLRDRYHGYGFRASSGAGWKGNFGWKCPGCGGRCKRDKCKDHLYKEDNDILCWYRLPKVGSQNWGQWTTNEVMSMYRTQKGVQKYVDENLTSSVDTFSGE